MKKLGAMAVAALLAVVITAGCSGSKGGEEELKAVCFNNIKALQEENLENYLATLHPESPGYAKMEEVCPQIFQMYDLDHKLLNIRVLDFSDKEGRVETVQEAIRLSGPENYKSNRTTMVHTLKKYQGQWKLYHTEQKSMEYIE